MQYTHAQIRWIQAWTHLGDHHLIHAIPDQPDQRRIMGLGRLGVFAVRACDRGKPFPHSRFMRLLPDPDDAPTYVDGWLERSNAAGHDWEAPTGSYFDRRCKRCAARLRHEARAEA